MSGIKIPGLVDTDFMVSTVPESFFCQHWGHERLQAWHWLQLKVTSGLLIPYLGYIDLGVELYGKPIPQCCGLIVKDPLGAGPSKVPTVLGMNVIWKCYQELFGQHGSALFSLGSVTEAPKSPAAKIP